MSNALDECVSAYQDTFEYSLDNRLMLNWYPRRILQYGLGASLLELGLGHGYTTRFFNQHVNRHLVVEGSRKVIDRFDRSGLSVEIVEGFFEDFHTDEQFQSIVLGFVLEHVENPDLILSRFARFLASGGNIYVTVPNACSLHRRIGHSAGMLQNMFALSSHDIELGHRRLYSVETLHTAILKTGLVIKATEGIFLKPITTKQLIALELSEEVYHGMLEAGVDYPELSAGILVKAGKV